MHSGWHDLVQAQVLYSRVATCKNGSSHEHQFWTQVGSSLVSFKLDANAFLSFFDRARAQAKKAKRFRNESLKEASWATGRVEPRELSRGFGTRMI